MKTMGAMVVAAMLMSGCGVTEAEQAQLEAEGQGSTEQELCYGDCTPPDYPDQYSCSEATNRRLWRANVVYSTTGYWTLEPHFWQPATLQEWTANRPAPCSSVTGSTVPVEGQKDDSMVCMRTEWLYRSYVKRTWCAAQRSPGVGTYYYDNNCSTCAARGGYQAVEWFWSK